MARKLIQTGKQFTQETQSDLSQPEEETKEPKERTGIFKGIAKGALSTAFGAGQLLEKGAAKLTGQKTLTETLTGKTREELGKPKFLTPQTTQEKVGFGIEQIGEYFLPIGEAKLITKIDDVVRLAKLAKTSGIISGLAKITGGVAKSIVSGSEFATKRAVQTGGDLEETKQAGIVGAVTPPIVKATFKVGGFLLKKVALLGSIITGKSSEAIKAVFKNPKAADEGVTRGNDAMRDLVNAGAEKSIKLRDAFIQGHNLAFQKLSKGFDKVKVSANIIKNSFIDYLKSGAVKIEKNKLDFSISKIKANPGEITKIKNAWEAIQKWDDYSLSGIVKLKQLIGVLRKFEDIGGTPSKSPTLGRFYHSLDNVIKQNLPKEVKSAYSELNKKFSENIDLYDDMVDAFNRGDPFKTLANVFAKNQDAIRRTIQLFEEKTGIKAKAIVAGREIAEEGTFAMFNPRTWFDFFISPTLQAKIITTLGKTIPKIPKIPKGLIPKGIGADIIIKNQEE